jgi:DNA (cytosine-5)-methyltransferase 1
VGENVRGLTNWNGGLVFDEVQSELEAQGYEVLPFLLPACAVNAPHRRDRIWFVAHSKSSRSTISKLGESQSKQQLQTWSNINGYDDLENASNSNGNGLNECNGNNEVNTSEGRINAFGDTNTSNGDGNVANSNSIRLEQCENGGEMGRGQGKMGGERGEPSNATQTNGEVSNASNTKCERYPRLYNTRQKNNVNWESSNLWGSITGHNKEINWFNFPTVSPICIGDDGFSDRLDSITFSKWRQESIKAGGNAIVPQVVHQIFKAIEEYERITTSNTD